MQHHHPLACRLAAASLLALCVPASQAQGQVYRCGDSGLYTDKPCDEARAVDLRSNLLQAGPKVAPVSESDQPSPPLILNNISRVVTTPPSPPSTVWQGSDSRQSAQTGVAAPAPQPYQPR